MARTIDYWFQSIITAKNENAALDGLNSTSKVAEFNLWAYIVAVVMAALDNLFDLHRSEVDAQLLTLKPHTATWYRDLALRFQYGQDTIADSDQYANMGLTEQQIAQQKIITQSAVTEVGGKLRVKVVKLVANDYAQLSDTEKAAFTAFMQSQKDAGVVINIDSLPPDSLKLALTVWYDPLVLAADGSRIDGTSATPVPDAINNYLKNLKFNGEYANGRMLDQVKSVDGAELAAITLSQASYGAFPLTNINEIYLPDGGYLRISDGNLTINYIPYVQY